MSDQIRVSCACLCRIEHAGRFLLLLNANRRARGLYILSPVGGALVLFDQTLLETWGAVPETPGSHDLRLRLPEAALPVFRDWFYSRQGREQSPLRELQEELVDEAGLLSELRSAEVSARHLWTVEEEAPTMRKGQAGLLTHYFLEVFEIKFAPEVLARLAEVPPNSGAAWISVDQIEARETVTLVVDGASRPAQINGQWVLRPPG